MPRARSVCAEPNCPELGIGKTGRCPGHQRETWAGSDRRTTLPKGWAAIRQQVLDRDGHTCQLRLPGCIGRATDVDHVGDRDDHRLQSLRAACRHCRRLRTLAQAAEGRRRAGR